MMIKNFNKKFVEILSKLRLSKPIIVENKVCSSDFSIKKKGKIDNKINIERCSSGNYLTAEAITFTAAHCGEIGIGEITGEKLDHFRDSLVSETLAESEFIKRPYEFFTNYCMGMFANDSVLNRAGLPEVSIVENGVLSIPKKDNKFKDGIYIVYVNLYSKYFDRFEACVPPNIEFSGARIDLGYIKQDFISGVLNNLIVVNEIKSNYAKEEVIKFFQPGHIVFSLIVKVDLDGEINTIYELLGGDEKYYTWFYA